MDLLPLTLATLSLCGIMAAMVAGMLVRRSGLTMTEAGESASAD